MQKSLLLLVLLFFAVMNEVYAQAAACGTEPTAAQVEFMKELVTVKNPNSRQANVLVKVPLKLHVVRQSDGTGGLSESQLLSAISTLNSFYINANIQFFIAGNINYINDSDLYDYHTNEEGALAVSNDVARVINIYFLNSIQSAAGYPLCGYTFFPPSADRVFMANDCTTSGNTLAHEIGHYFTLYHTHGKSNTGSTDEYVNGSNCQNAGDDVCDTPADPNLTGVVQNCVYTGNQRDPNGDMYRPMVSNIMSYAPGNCRNVFTSGQYSRIRTGFEQGRYYLNYEVESFAAAFQSDERTICVGSTVKYEADVPGARSYYWEFEGGNPATSTSKTPVVTYSTEGMYAVSLIVKDASNNADQVIRSAWVEVNNPLNEAITNPVIAAFDSGIEVEWQIINPDRSKTFEVTDTVGSAYAAEGQVLIMENFTYEPDAFPQLDYLISPYYVAQGVQNFVLSLDYAYAYRQSFNVINSDTLKLAYRLDCSEDWVPFLSVGGTALATSAPTNDYFVPEAEEWRTKEFVLTNTFGSAGAVQFALINVTTSGNNLYIDNLKINPDYSLVAPSLLEMPKLDGTALYLRWRDNSNNETGFVIERKIAGGEYQQVGTVAANTYLFIDNIADHAGQELYYRVYAAGVGTHRSGFTNELQVSGNVTGVDELLQLGVKVYPNPLTDKLIIETGSDIEETFDVMVMDMHGRILLEQRKLGGGQATSVTLNTSHLPSGMYFVRFTGDKKATLSTIKVIKQ